MKLPSFSIAEMMVIVAVVALDCGVIRMAGWGPAIPYLVLGGLPMQIVLIIFLRLMFRRRRRRIEKPQTFLIGFEIVGWIGHLSYVVLCLHAVGSIDRHLTDTLAPPLRAMGFSPFSAADMLVLTVLMSFYVTAPQVAIALVAGWISQRWWKQTRLETAPTHD